MQQKIKNVSCQLLAGFLAVMMLVTCVGNVSYAAESASPEVTGKIYEQEEGSPSDEQAEGEYFNSVSQNEIEEAAEIVSEQINVFAADTNTEGTEIAEEQIVVEVENISSGILQTGGLLDAENTLPQIMFYETENVVDEMKASLIAAFDSFSTECNVSQYEISKDEFEAVFTPILVEVLNTNPRFFYVDTDEGYGYSYNTSTGYVTKVSVSFEYDQNTINTMLSEYKAAVDKVVDGAVSTWSDMEKALYINDYLTRNCEYEVTISKENIYDAYGVFVNREAVCQGYALAYLALAEELGLECELVTSKSLNHAWNLISVNGNYYNVDATWNDPIADLLGRARHLYFMKSTEEYKTQELDHFKEADWVVTGGRTDTDAFDTNYDTYFWNDVDCGFEYLDGYWYNFDGVDQIAKYSCDGCTFVKNTKVQDITDKWYKLDLITYYLDKYVGTGSYKGVFYYSTDDAIYTWNPTNDVLTKIFELSAEQKTTGYIYGLYVDSLGDIYYYTAPDRDPESVGTVNRIANNNTDLLLDECYVSQNGNDSNAGTEASPVGTLYKALELIDDGGTIYVCDNLVVNDNASNDAPLVIEKEVTIQAKESSLPTITLWAGGIILGADVTFKNVKIGTGSFLRPGIAANGHKLHLVNVQEDSSLRPLQIYGGTFIDYTTKADYGLTCRGLASEITIVDGDYDAVYAGSVNGSVDLPVTINVSKENYLVLGGIYAGSTIKTSEMTSIPMLDNSVNLSCAVNVSISNNAYVTVVDGVSQSNTVNLITNGSGRYSFEVAYLDNLKVIGGTFTPATGSILGNDGSNKPNIILEGSNDNKATLDLSECTSNSNVICVNNFTGTPNSILVLNKEHTMEIFGELTGESIEFRLSGGMPWNSEETPGYSGLMEYGKTYITGGYGDGSFVISNPYGTQEDMKFTEDSSAVNGWTTVESSEFEIPQLVDFSITSKVVSYDEINTNNGVIIDVSATYTEEEWYPYLYYIPLEYQITYTDTLGNAKEYSKQSSVADDIGSYSCEYTASTSLASSTEILMKFEPYADEEGNTTIVIRKAEANIAAGNYQIEVTAPTTSGLVTRGFSLQVTANDGGGNDGGGDPGIVEPEEITYSITYHGNGATDGFMLTQSELKQDISYMLQANTYSRIGYTFAGWNTKADGSGTPYAEQATVRNLASTNGDNIILYAQWEKINYSITYNLNGGTNSSSNPKSYNVTTSTITLKNPTRTGYTFGGWYSDSNCTKKVTTILTGSTGDKTFYAKWTVNKYNIVFKGNGSNSGRMANLSCNYGSSYTLKANAFKRTGYTFTGWNTKANGTGITYRNVARVKSLTSFNGRTITLYAQWKPVKYTIRYSLNGGKNHKKNPTSYTAATANIRLQAPTRTGYTFKGWYSDKKCTKKVTVIKKGCTGNQTLYAKWTAVNYSIKYNLNGGKNNSKNPKKYTVATSNIKLQTPTKKGYTFKGWYSDKKYTKKVTMIKKGSTGNKILYAKWVKK